jgi:hypothetical protein
LDGGSVGVVGREPGVDVGRSTRKWRGSGSGKTLRAIGGRFAARAPGWRRVRSSDASSGAAAALPREPFAKAFGRRSASGLGCVADRRGRSAASDKLPRIAADPRSDQNRT